MLVIRLLRVGKKNQPSFKVVVTDKKNPPRGGRFVEEVGFYNSLTKEKNLKKERIQYWISQGAQPSDTVYNMLVSEKIIEGEKIPSHKKSKKEEPASSAGAPERRKEETAEPEKPAEEPKKEEASEKPEKAVEEPKEEDKKEEAQEQRPEEKAPEAEPQATESQKEEEKK